jgi:hypothetical protein
MRAEPSKREAETSKKDAVFVACVGIDCKGSSFEAALLQSEFRPRIHFSFASPITFRLPLDTLNNKLAASVGPERTY